jgi:hypothetical protein
VHALLQAMSNMACALSRMGAELAASPAARALLAAFDAHAAALPPGQRPQDAAALATAMRACGCAPALFRPQHHLPAAPQPAALRPPSGPPPVPMPMPSGLPVQMAAQARGQLGATMATPHDAAQPCTWQRTSSPGPYAQQQQQYQQQQQHQPYIAAMWPVNMQPGMPAHHGPVTASHYNMLAQQLAAQKLGAAAAGPLLVLPVPANAGFVPHHAAVQQYAVPQQAQPPPTAQSPGATSEKDAAAHQAHLLTILAALKEMQQMQVR